MPTLEEIIEIGTASAERTLRESRLMDFAWMKDRQLMEAGQAPHHLQDFMDRQLSELLGEVYADDQPSG